MAEAAASGTMVTPQGPQRQEVQQIDTLQCRFNALAEVFGPQAQEPQGRDGDEIGPELDEFCHSSGVGG